jgi:tetratricopeptide (TPR) repeat protein
MKQNEPANPREPQTDRNTTSVQQSGIAAEIAGYADIGMRKEALRAVRKVLGKQRISLEEFSEALRTIEMHSSSKNLNKWKSKLEAVYNRQSRKFKRKVRSDMLALYAERKEWQTALQFVSLRKLTCAGDVLFGMQVLLELGKLDDAKALAIRCGQLLRVAQDRFHQAVILTALGDFFSQTHQWDDAIATWERMPLEQPFRQNALSGIVQMHLARAFESAERGLQLLSELKEHPNNENELCLPNNDLGMTLHAEKALLKFKRGIKRLLPDKTRKELGISTENT